MCEAYYREELAVAKANLDIETKSRINSDAMLAIAIRKLRDFEPDVDWRMVIRKEVKKGDKQ